MGGARKIGDLNNPDSEVATLLRENRDDIKTLKPDLDTRPHVFYIGLPDAFVDGIDGQAGVRVVAGH